MALLFASSSAVSAEGELQAFEYTATAAETGGGPLSVQVVEFPHDQLKYTKRYIAEYLAKHGPQQVNFFYMTPVDPAIAKHPVVAALNPTAAKVLVTEKPNFPLLTYDPAASKTDAADAMQVMADLAEEKSAAHVAVKVPYWQQVALSKKNWTLTLITFATEAGITTSVMFCRYHVPFPLAVTIGVVEGVYSAFFVKISDSYPAWLADKKWFVPSGEKIADPKIRHRRVMAKRLGMLYAHSMALRAVRYYVGASPSVLPSTVLGTAGLIGQPLWYVFASKPWYDMFTDMARERGREPTTKEKAFIRLGLFGITMVNDMAFLLTALGFPEVGYGIQLGILLSGLTVKHWKAIKYFGFKLGSAWRSMGEFLRTKVPCGWMRLKQRASDFFSRGPPPGIPFP